MIIPRVRRRGAPAGSGHQHRSSYGRPDPPVRRTAKAKRKLGSLKRCRVKGKHVRCRPDEHRHHLRRRESGPVAGKQSPPAATAAYRIDRYARDAQGIEIALDGSRGDVEVVCELVDG